MSELSPETRAWIDATARDDAPRADDRARIRQRLALELGVASLAAATAVTVTAQATSLSLSAGAVAAKGAGVSLFAKLAVAVALAGAVSSGAFVAMRGSDQDERPQNSALASRAAHTKSAGLLERGAPLQAAAPLQPIVEQLEPPSADTPREQTLLVKKTALEKRPAPHAVRAPANIADELLLLREANLALRAGHPDAALEKTSEHAARFPQGVMQEERAAVEMLALCAKGRASQERLTAFLRNAPESPLKVRVRAACQGK